MPTIEDRDRGLFPAVCNAFDVPLRNDEMSRLLRAVLSPHEREAVALGPGVEWKVNDLVRIYEGCDDLETVLVQLGSLAVWIHEVDGTVRSQEEVPFDIRFAGHVKGRADAVSVVREAIEQSLVKRRDDFGSIPNDDRGFHAVADDDLSTMHDVHEDSLTGYGADCVSAPMATMEAATSVVGDIVRDGADITPASPDSAVEESAANGAAGSEGSLRRPHPIRDDESP